MMQPLEYRHGYPYATNDAWTAGLENGWERARSPSCNGVRIGEHRDACRAGDEDYADRLEKDPGACFQTGQDTNVIDAPGSARERANTQDLHSRSQRSRIPRPISRDSNDEHGTNLALIVPPSKIPRPISSRSAFIRGSTSMPNLPPPSTEIPSNVTLSSNSSSYNDSKPAHLTFQKRHISIAFPSSSPITPNPLTINITSNPSSPTIDTLLDACIAKSHALLAAARTALATPANFQDPGPDSEAGTDDDDYECKGRVKSAPSRKNDVSAMTQVEEEGEEEEEQSGIQRHDSSAHSRRRTTNVRNTPTGAGEEEQSRSDLDSAPSTTTSRNKDIVRVGGWYKITNERPSHWRAIGRG